MSETFSLAEIKAHLSEVVDRIEKEHERIILTRDGRPAAVLISPEDLAGLEDSLDLLSDPQAMAEIEAARRDAAEGRTEGADELRARYLDR
jgi:antitoxin YefM